MPSGCDSTHWIRGWLGPRAGVNMKEKNLCPLLGIKVRFPGHPAHNLVTILTELSHLMYTLDIKYKYERITIVMWKQENLFQTPSLTRGNWDLFVQKP
jgi:hypothetical protein